MAGIRYRNQRHAASPAEWKGRCSEPSGAECMSSDISVWIDIWLIHLRTKETWPSTVEREEECYLGIFGYVGYGNCFTFNVKCPNNNEGYDYSMAFVWMLLHVNISQSGLRILTDFAYSAGAICVHWGHWHKKSPLVCIGHGKMLTWVLIDNCPVTLRLVFQITACNLGYGLSYSDVDLSYPRVYSHSFCMLECVTVLVRLVPEVALTIWHPQTRIKLENISFISYLVFHHSLRIRLKDDILDEKKQDKKEICAEASAEASSPSSTSAHTEGAGSVSDETLVAAEPVSNGGHVKEKTAAIVGRINNLVTSDLSSIEDSFRVVEIREYLIRRCFSI